MALIWGRIREAGGRGWGDSGLDFVCETEEREMRWGVWCEW